jgi:hypothetical protein
MHLARLLAASRLCLHVRGVSSQHQRTWSQSPNPLPPHMYTPLSPCCPVLPCPVRQVNVYKLGAVYLQLTKLLRLEDHPCLTRPIDPCLYIHRFAEKLLAEQEQREVSRRGGRGETKCVQGCRVTRVCC